MLKELKNQLLVSCIAAVALLLIGVWVGLHGIAWLSAALSIIVCLYLIGVNLWFSSRVSEPIAKLSDHARRIAEGTYGIKLEKERDDELGVLTEEINDMSEKVAIAEKSRTEFISQVSHELRTPLTAITGWAETIAYDPAVQGDSLRGIHIISKEAERLTGMVKELLEFTRIQDGRFNLRVELIDIAAELEDALFTYGELMRQAGIEVNYTEPPVEIPLIPGDPERLKQVFCNVLDNAAKHGGAGKRIEARLNRKGNHYIITIRDYGPGIPNDDLPHVKEKFYKGASKARGSGIGLAVCDEIIRLHDGALTIGNAKGGGCIVTIRLPITSHRLAHEKEKKQ